MIAVLRRRSRILGLALLAIGLASLAALYYVGVVGWGPELPPLPRPALGEFEPGVRAQIERALEEAHANPEDPLANGKLGMILHTYEQYGAAAACYRRAQLLAPDAFKWTYYLGIAQAEEGRHDEALAALEAAVALEPDYAPAQVTLADELFAVGRTEEARGLYEAALEREPGSPRAHYGLGRALAGLGDPRTALDHLALAVQLAPTFAGAHYALGLAYRDLGRTDEAEAHLELSQRYKDAPQPQADPWITAVAELNRSARRHLLRADVLLRQNRLRETMQELERALRSDPQNLPAHTNLIDLHTRLGDFEKAAQHYRVAMSLNPSALRAKLNYGEALERQKRFEEAAAIYGEALAINPLRADTHVSLGTLRERQGRAVEALGHYRQALASEPNNPRAHLLLGRRLLLGGDGETAAGHFEKVLAAGGNRAAWLHDIARIYVEAKRPAAAVPVYRQARRHASSASDWRRLAFIERELCEIERALGRE